MHHHHSNHHHSREQEIAAGVATGLVVGTIIAKNPSAINDTINDIYEDGGCAGLVGGIGCLTLFFAPPIGLGILLLALVIFIITFLYKIVSEAVSWVQSLGKLKFVLAILFVGFSFFFLIDNSNSPDKTSKPIQTLSPENNNLQNTTALTEGGLNTESSNDLIGADNSPPEATPDAELTNDSAIGERPADPSASGDALSTPNEPSQSVSPSITSEVEPIVGTHTPPSYPALSAKYGEQGESVLLVFISLDGAPTDCTVQESSGSHRLDDAACTHVMRKWRWMPPVINGNAAFGKKQIRIIWD